MRSLRRKAGLLSLGVIAALAVVVPGGVARATTLNGDWAAFSRCPVTNSSMLAADGVNISAQCVATSSASGSIKLGNTTAPITTSDLQLGALFNSSTTVSAPVAPSGGALAAAPVNIPGGLLGLICPSSVPLITQICNSITNSTLNTVTATIEPAGSPSNLNLGAAFVTGTPLVRLPVKIHLSNPILGSSCFIGSNSNPIVLNPEMSVAPTNFQGDTFDANGTSDPNGIFTLFTVSGGTTVDNSFAVPGASGCDGLLSLLVDAAVDLKVGLPSASGHNSLTLNNPTISTAGYGDPTSVAPNEGKDLAAAWQSAITG